MSRFLKNWRIWIAEGYAVTALVLTALIVAALTLRLKSERDDSDRERAILVYREMAQSIREGEVPSEKSKYIENLVARGRLGRGTWGFESAPHDRVLVWYREPRQNFVRVADVPKYESAFFCGRFAAFLVVSLLTILLLALLSVRYFHGFMKERDDFIAAVAHDLRTPLATLSLQTIRASEDVRQTVQRLRNLVANLTEFLKLGGKRPAAKRERIDLVAIYHEAFVSFREGYEDVDCAVTIEGPSELFAQGDSDLVLQIFWNLIGNDLKYAAAEGPVTVRFFSDRGRAVVEFADEGPGMSRAARRRCFNRYYRATTIAASGKGGFGIGLCNAREFARAMHGSLTVRANRPHGCVFQLVLPQTT